MKAQDLKPYPATNPLEFAECSHCSSLPGSPPLCPSCYHNREVIQKIRQATLKEAAAWLNRTAGDFRNMARQARRDAPPPGSLGRPESMQKAQSFEDKAALLEGQARQIEGL